MGLTLRPVSDFRIAEREISIINPWRSTERSESVDNFVKDLNAALLESKVYFAGRLARNADLARPRPDARRVGRSLSLL